MQKDMPNIALSASQVRRIVRAESARSRGLWMITLGGLSAVILAVAYGYYLRRDFVVLDAWWPFLISIALWWVFMLGYWPWTFARSEQYRRLMLPGTLRFADATIRLDWADGASKSLPIASLARVILRADYALLYDQDGSVVVVPFWTFENEQEAQQMKAALAHGAPCNHSRLRLWS